MLRVDLLLQSSPTPPLPCTYTKFCTPQRFLRPEHHCTCNVHKSTQKTQRPTVIGCEVLLTNNKVCTFAAFLT